MLPVWATFRADRGWLPHLRDMARWFREIAQCGVA
jgi:hypothetical protein